MNRAIFLDRDGTMVEDVGYCRREEDLNLLPTVAKSVKLFNNYGFRVIVITNQSGVARRYFTKGKLAQLHQKMLRDLSQENGAYIDGLLYCPHHPDDLCSCRKPGTHLFEVAAKNWNIDYSRSFVVGDRIADIEAAKALNCRSVLVTTGPDGKKGVEAEPDFVAKTLQQAADWILSNG